jgi:transcriptional regulator with XRE-family HTH domain
MKYLSGAAYYSLFLNVSTDKSRLSKIISSGGVAIFPARMKNKETPQEYVNRVLAETGLSHVQVSARAQKLGYKLSAGYVHNIARGTADNPSIQLMQALAAGLGRPEDEVDAVFRGRPITEELKYKNSYFARLWGEFKELSDADQKELRIVLDNQQREIQRRLKT